MRKWFVSCLLIVSMCLTGCFGSFTLTRKLWTFNKDISHNRFIQELLFLGLNILPVYWILAIGDLFIFNLIELFTGKNVLSYQGTTVDGRALAMERLDDHRVLIKIEDEEFILTREDGRMTLTDKTGMVQSIGYVGKDGALVITRPGTVVEVDGDSIAALQQDPTQIAGFLEQTIPTLHAL